MLRSWAHTLRGAIPGAFVLLGSCTFLLDPDDTLRCVAPEDGQDDPCPEGSHCRQGECRKDGLPDGAMCDPPVDVEPSCNGIDDDCDGEVDEGNDTDGDKYSWCGAGVLEDSDCADDDPDIHPGAKEICDGRDNDCDGKVDEEDPDHPLCEGAKKCLGQTCATPNCLQEGSSVRCEADERCTPDGICVKGEGCTSESCAESEVCEEKSGTCVGRAKENGEPCAAHNECASGSCIDTAALRMGRPEKRVCGKACCSDADCEGAEFCFASGSGARSCLPRVLDPRADPSLVACASDAACGDDGALACTLRTLETNGSEALTTRRGIAATVCERPSGTTATGAPCSSDEACRSGICQGDFLLRTCSLPCGTADECEPLLRGGRERAYCRTRAHSDGPFSPTNYVPVCVYAPGGLGTKGQNEPCQAASECAEGACVIPGSSDIGLCAQACCNSTQCTDGTTCRPYRFGDQYEMRCLP